MQGTLSQKKAIKLLKENGWMQTRGGRHQVKMTKPGCRPVTQTGRIAGRQEHDLVAIR